MSKPQTLSEIRVVYGREFDQLDKKIILEENTYLYDSSAIEEVEIMLTLIGGRQVIINFKDVLDWEVRMDDIYIDDEILE